MDDERFPAELRAWIEESVGGSVRATRRHLAGASRQAWSVDVEADGDVLALFVLRDLGTSGGSWRDAAVLRALGSTAIPVPTVHAADEGLAAVLLERLEGASELTGDDGVVDEAAARHLMEAAAALHRLDPADLAIAHLGPPDADGDPAATQLAGVEQIAAMAGDGLETLFGFALAWLARNRPAGIGRPSLVHSDMGPGNLLHLDGRVTALLDWEVAHWGDPMEDLAAIAVRDMATPVGHLPTRFAEYAEAGGPPVDLARVQWYRVLVLVRNSMLIGMGLARDDAAVDRAQLTMFRTLLMRAAALSLCDAVGVARPGEPPLVEGASSEALVLAAHAWRDLRDTIVPAVDDPFAASRAHGAAGIVGHLEHRLRYGADFERRESEDLAALLGGTPADRSTIKARLREQFADPAHEQALAGFFARAMQRRSMLVEPLLGPLMDRLPQRLADA
jgi:aminoglycoside phosphotransferase (APT) family kinase protein